MIIDKQLNSVILLERLSLCCGKITGFASLRYTIVLKNARATLSSNQK